MAWSDAARAAAIEIRRRKSASRLVVVHPGTGKAQNLSRSDIAKRIRELRRVTRDAATKRGKLRRAIMQLAVFKGASGSRAGWSDAARAAALAARRRKMKPDDPTKPRTPGVVPPVTTPRPPGEGDSKTGRVRQAVSRRSNTVNSIRKDLADRFGLRVYLQRRVDSARGADVLKGVHAELDELHREFDLPRVKGLYSAEGRLKLLEKGRKGLNGQFSYGAGHLSLILGTREIGANRTINLGNTDPSSRWTVGNTILGTFRHEYGHASMHELNRRAVAMGLRNFDSFGHKELGSRISQYARTNNHELFAEAFSLYTSRDYSRGVRGRDLPNELADWFEAVLPRKGKNRAR